MNLLIEEEGDESMYKKFATMFQKNIGETMNEILQWAMVLSMFIAMIIGKCSALLTHCRIERYQEAFVNDHNILGGSAPMLK